MLEGKMRLVLCTARLGLKAPALAWPEVALAFKNTQPGQSRHPRLGPGLAWPRPWLLYENMFDLLPSRPVSVQKSLRVIHWPLVLIFN